MDSVLKVRYSEGSHSPEKAGKLMEFFHLENSLIFTFDPPFLAHSKSIYAGFRIVNAVVHNSYVMKGHIVKLSVSEYEIRFVIDT